MSTQKTKKTGNTKKCLRYYWQWEDQLYEEPFGPCTSPKACVEEASQRSDLHLYTTTKGKGDEASTAATIMVGFASPVPPDTDYLDRHFAADVAEHMTSYLGDNCDVGGVDLIQGNRKLVDRGYKDLGDFLHQWCLTYLRSVTPRLDQITCTTYEIPYDRATDEATQLQRRLSDLLVQNSFLSPEIQQAMQTLRSLLDVATKEV